jgi:hypothetical protein
MHLQLLARLFWLVLFLADLVWWHRSLRHLERPSVLQVCFHVQGLLWSWQHLRAGDH